MGIDNDGQKPDVEDKVKPPEGPDVEQTAVDLPQLIKWFDEYSWTSAVERDLAEKCEDYRDGAQWTQDEREELERRGQPPTVVNRIWPKVNTIVGYEIRGRSVPRARPIPTDGWDSSQMPFAEESADAVSDALRSVCDDDKSGDRDNIPRVFSRVLEGLVTTGLSGCMLRLDSKQVQRRDGVKEEFQPYGVHVSRDRLIWDQHSRELDFSDDKFRGLTTWWDVADAAEEWPDYIDLFDDAALNGASQGTIMGANKDRPQNWYNFERRRVRINEIFWRERDNNGIKQWWHAIYTVTGFLPASKEQKEPGPELVPYLDEDGNTWCPLKMVRAWVTRYNAAYGVVAQLISVQDSINKRESKIMHELQNEGVIAEREAIPDINQFREERAKPDGVAIVQPGAIKDQKFMLRDNLDKVQAQIPLLASSKDEIDRCGPSLPAIAGEGGRDMSGAAIARRQSLGSIELEPLFDPFRNFKLQIYTGLWLMIRQYVDYEWWRRVEDNDTLPGYRFVALNRQLTRAARAQELIDHKMPVAAAFQSIDLSPAEVAQIQQDVAQQMQQAQQQMTQGQNPQQLPPQVQQQMQAHLQQMQRQAMMNHPLMTQPFIANEVGKLHVSIKLDEVPDVTIQQQEQFEIIADMAGKGIFNPQITPPWAARAMIEMSQLRDKRKFLKAFDQAQQQDPQVVQAKQLEMQLELQQKRADIANTGAQTQERLAVANLAPAKMAGEHAYAMGAAVDAGRKSVPQPPQNLPAMAAGTKGKVK